LSSAACWERATSPGRAPEAETYIQLSQANRRTGELLVAEFLGYTDSDTTVEPNLVARQEVNSFIQRIA
jgi:hypothetical protein